MKNYLKTEKNQYEQNVGIKLDLTAIPEIEHFSIYGKHVVLHALMHNGDVQAKWVDQIWDTVKSEPNESCWTYLPYQSFDSKNVLEQKLKNNFEFLGSLHYLIEVDQKIVGWIALLNVRPEHGAVEIGNVYFSHKLKQSTASTEIIYLLLQLCFDQNYRRIEWKCDELNEPSKRAALRYGFTYEGTFRQDRIAKNRNRNTAWFSILDEEWLALEQAYKAWLSDDNFDVDGQQKIRLNDFIQLYSA